MKHITIGIFSLFLLTSIQSFAQGSDMVVLKKRNNRTLKTYFPGLQIHFITMAGDEVKGTVRKIANDSIFINIYDERRAYTAFGTSFWDTIAVGLSRYHLNEIREVVKPHKGFSFIRNGFLFMLGGTSYAFLHVFNSAIYKEKVDTRTLAWCAGSIATGYMLKRIHRNTVHLGKRYYLQYIPLK